MFAVFNFVKASPISLSAVSQEIGFPDFRGSFKRSFSSYNDKMEATTLALMSAPASLLGITKIGRPSLVFIKTLAKSYPSATVVAYQSATPGIISFGLTT
ncbi:MAG: Uncharacterised protein [Polaribacter sp. SA4-10]|nr:MAG: Uncharacterised protein [Polaribacter sp. SA4-10]